VLAKHTYSIKHCFGHWWSRKKAGRAPALMKYLSKTASETYFGEIFRLIIIFILNNSVNSEILGNVAKRESC
jgi:hypothetical protein